MESGSRGSRSTTEEAVLLVNKKVTVQSWQTPDSVQFNALSVVLSSPALVVFPGSPCRYHSRHCSRFVVALFMVIVCQLPRVTSRCPAVVSEFDITASSTSNFNVCVSEHLKKWKQVPFDGNTRDFGNKVNLNDLTPLKSVSSSPFDTV